MIEHELALELSHATEAGAIAAARAAGFGDKEAADQAATEAMRAFLNTVDFHGRIVIGEGERDAAPMLYIGEELGAKGGAHNGKRGHSDISTTRAIDIAVDPLENTNATASLGPRAISVLAAAEKNGLFHAPDMYMEKLIVPNEAAGKVKLDDPAEKTVRTVARSLGRDVADLVVVILDRPRNQSYIDGVRKAGARVKLVPDGDLMPGIAACMRGSGVHALMGIGAAPEGVITAAALRCIKGGMQARFWPRDDAEKKRLRDMGGNHTKIYTQHELASGREIIFAATGVTSCEILNGVDFFAGGARTHTLVMSTITNKIRFINTTHIFDKTQVEYRV